MSQRVQKLGIPRVTTLVLVLLWILAWFLIMNKTTHFSVLIFWNFFPLSQKNSSARRVLLANVFIQGHVRFMVGIPDVFIGAGFGFSDVKSHSKRLPRTAVDYQYDRAAFFWARLRYEIMGTELIFFRRKHDKSEFWKINSGIIRQSYARKRFLGGSTWPRASCVSMLKQYAPDTQYSTLSLQFWK